MAIGIPPVPRRLGLSRDMMEFLEALRNAVGGDSADSSSDIDLSSLATIPVAVAQEAPQDVAPVGVFEIAPVGSD